MAHLLQPVGDTQITQLGNRKTRVTAGINARKRFQVHINIQTQAMITTTFSNAQTKRGNLGLPDVNARRTFSAIRLYLVTFESINYRFFNP